MKLVRSDTIYLGSKVGQKVDWNFKAPRKISIEIGDTL
jgi:hypothetical protein